MKICTEEIFLSHLRGYYAYTQGHDQISIFSFIIWTFSPEQIATVFAEIGPPVCGILLTESRWISINTSPAIDVLEDFGDRRRSRPFFVDKSSFCRFLFARRASLGFRCRTILILDNSFAEYELPLMKLVFRVHKHPKVSSGVGRGGGKFDLLKFYEWQINSGFSSTRTSYE